ncbi:hypothetical protein NA63_2551 [Flavobacteriaceae bacterium MAR_2010_105]|nr:hypothetical protein NA63_2551 [Flavobacteriaceae bacterium MAR_2010_105]
MNAHTPRKQPWLKLYSLVLLANILYFVLFYFIMKTF